MRSGTVLAPLSPRMTWLSRSYGTTVDGYSYVIPKRHVRVVTDLSLNPWTG
ncbi:hypothetical protein GCM10023317_45150 [Actinopolymorpha pittospori]